MPASKRQHGTTKSVRPGSMSNSWFEVDKAGLAKIVAARGKVFVLYELLQNAFDEDGVTEIAVRFEPIPGHPEVLLEIIDDSHNGFRRLSDAWTIFAASYKKSHAQKRGRFNLGEKLVLSLCEEAHLISTTGSVHFTANGRQKGREKRTKGTLFKARMKMSREEFEQACRDVVKVIPPPAMATTFNGGLLPTRECVVSFEATLPTVIGEELRRTERKTSVRVYRPLAGESASIYEMGIPVVETGDAFHVDVGQKVPLNMDRDNVPPSFLRALRVEVVNHTSHLIDTARAASTEVQEATSDSRCHSEAVDRMLTQRFGEKRFTFDPSDPEANKRLVSEGYAPIMGGSLNSGQWERVKSHQLSQPAGEISPSPKCYAEFGRPENIVTPDKWTPGMTRQVAWIKRYALALKLGAIGVRIAREPLVHWCANYGPGCLTLNLAKLGHSWFDAFPANLQEVIDLMIHEFGHHDCSDHLSEDYYRALTRLGAKSTLLALTNPGVFSHT